jgi:hypothetical protein
MWVQLTFSNGASCIPHTLGLKAVSILWFAPVRPEFHCRGVDREPTCSELQRTAALLPFLTALLFVFTTVWPI